ncbi:unnamed protein product [Ilex paraguariensis]|uniref:Uncharacterized protein n=1 Tax=Ilex paraguariensis TaxID=185542 RepID=A0ABC8T9K6_9AQUA
MGSLLHYMLPRKRPVEGEVVDGHDSSSGGESLLKKHQIGCLIFSSRTATDKTTTSDDNKQSGEVKSNSAIGNSSNEPSLTDMAFDNGNPHDIDEDLHSRQLAVYGRETMRRLFASNVLVSGMQGLGAEIGMDVICQFTSLLAMGLYILFYVMLDIVA